MNEPTITDAEREHLRTHLTDGAWHDGCQFCLNRRRRGGTGLLAADDTEAQA